MKKRVFKTRVGTCAMLLAVFLLVGGVGGPAFAREDISNGQTGDPGDGLDRDGGGSNERAPTGGDSTSASTSGARLAMPGKTPFVLIPIYGANGLHFVVVFNFAHLAVALK